MFRHTRSGSIRIDDIVYELADVVVAVPEYALPAGISHSEIDDNPRLFTEGGDQRVANAAYISLVDSVMQNLTAVQDAKAAREQSVVDAEEAAETAVYDALPLDQRRQIYYNAKGLTTDRWGRAQIQQDIDGSSSELTSFTDDRAAAKAHADYPA